MTTLSVLMSLATLFAQQPAPPAPVAPTDSAPAAQILPAQRVTVPILVRETKPNYTPAAMRARIQGVVRLECVVEVDGSVGAVRVIRSLDATYGLDDEAMRTVKQWRFVPGKKDGTPVRVAVMIEVSFTLRDRADPAPAATAVTALAPVAWPAGFIGDNDPPAADWLEDSVQTSSLFVRFAYPPAWSILKSTDPHRLVTLHASDAAGDRTLTISQDERPAPVLLGAPLTQAALNNFFAGMNLSGGTRGMQGIGTGQIIRTGGLWVWFEGAASNFDGLNAPPTIAQYLRTAHSGMHLWSFTTTVNGQIVNVFCSVLHKANATDSDKQDEIRQSAVDFGAILRRVSLQPR